MAKQEKPTAPPTWESAAAELDRIAELDDDWDHEGAQAPWSATVARARRWLDFLQHLGTNRAPLIRVGLNRNIHFDWQGPKGWFTIEFEGSGATEATDTPMKGTAWHSGEL